MTTKGIGVALIALALAWGLSGCGKTTAQYKADVAEGHRMADMALERGRAGTAYGILYLVYGIEPPRLDAHAKAVRADIKFRLAAVALDLRKPRVALDECADGLKLAAPGSPEAINLLIAKGRALKALGDLEGATSVWEGAQVAAETQLELALSPPPTDPRTPQTQGTK